MMEMDIHDPELTPGLQEGDIAEMEQINRVGLRFSIPSNIIL